MQRVIVMGPPGSGKSTLARRLGARFELPVFHLDQAFWRPGWIRAPPDAFRAEVERISALPTWIMDGNYTQTIEPPLRAADTLIYLDVPSWLSMVRIGRRLAMNFGRVRADSARGCPDKPDLAFLLFAWRWNRIHRARYLDLVAGFDGRGLVLTSREDVDRLAGT